MRKLLIAILVACFYLNGAGQINKTKKSETLLKELSDNGCKCIDSIDTYNKTKEEVATAINKCIDAQAGAYQLGSKLMNIDLSNLATGDGKKTLDISINTDKDSKDYKDSYYEIERYLMANCKSLANKVAASDLENFLFSIKESGSQKTIFEGH